MFDVVEAEILAGDVDPLRAEKGPVVLEQRGFDVEGELGEGVVEIDSDGFPARVVVEGVD